jgi:betaine-aldehyde dehydrogenase
MFGIYAARARSAARLASALEKKIADKFLATRRASNKIIVGDGMKPETEMGPLITPAHMEKVLGYIETGKREGAKLICGGNRLTKGKLAAGNFVAPTVFVKTKPSMKIVREEIFGPVLVVQLFETEEEALRLANDTIYGLAGAVFTSDGGKGLRVLKKLRAGITWLNTYHPTFNEAPWGG